MNANNRNMRDDTVLETIWSGIVAGFGLMVGFAAIGAAQVLVLWLIRG